MSWIIDVLFQDSIKIHNKCWLSVMLNCWTWQGQTAVPSWYNLPWQGRTKPWPWAHALNYHVNEYAHKLKRYLWPQSRRSEQYGKTQELAMLLVHADFLLMPNSATLVILFLFQSAVGFEYQGKTEKHPSQKGKVGRWSPWWAHFL